MKHFLLYFFLLISPVTSFAQHERENEIQASSTNNIDIVYDFIDDLNNTQIALDVILSKSVIVNQPTDELYDYLEASLEEIRLNLIYKDIELVTVKNFNELPRREVRDIDPEGLDVNNMFFVYYKDRLVFSLYVEKDKIGSFTLVSKGDDMAHFVRY